MYNFHNRQFIFRQTTGELWNFFCDSGQNMCYNTLTNRGIWSNAVVLHRNVYQYFYAEMDQDDVYHILFQDINGNVKYSRLDGQSIKTVQLLSSKTPSAYDKQLYIAPLSDALHFFYVLQYDNSFMLAYQTHGNSRMGTPMVVDYVSGSSQPCSIVYDRGQNIYAFYQSYDGKYLQIGYKKFSTAQKHWSDFIPVTKYAGNCEYPHVIVDSNGILHLCYQRRTPRLFEMVYQQKAPDRNLWSEETVIHSSVHSFENASILQIQDRVVIYWVREDVVYYNTGSLKGSSWGKASRYGTQLGHQLLCLCYKSNSPRDRIQGDGSLKGDGSPGPLRGDGSPPSPLSPGIYPGSLSNGLKLLFGTQGDGSPKGDGSQLFSLGSTIGNVPEKNLNRFVADTLLQLQGTIEEIREGWSEARREISQLTNAYIELKKEVEKVSIYINVLKKQINQNKKQLNQDKRLAEKPEISLDETNSEIEHKTSQNSQNPSMASEATEKSTDAPLKGKPTASTLDPEKLQEWENWQEPKQWQGINE